MRLVYDGTPSLLLHEARVPEHGRPVAAEDLAGGSRARVFAEPGQRPVALIEWAPGTSAEVVLLARLYLAFAAGHLARARNGAAPGCLLWLERQTDGLYARLTFALRPHTGEPRLPRVYRGGKALDAARPTRLVPLAEVEDLVGHPLAGGRGRP